MLGSFAVGKTSLVRRFVSGIYSEDYITTIGARVEKKCITIEDRPLNLLVWDLNGEDKFQKLNMDYVQGSEGYLLVIDKTRPASLEVAHTLHQKAQIVLGDIPFILVINKSDLPDAWDAQEKEIEQLREQGWIIKTTSAKTGTGVDEVFESLARLIMQT
ncbi:MAG: GTP-binding protein [Rhodothermaceae bacterium]|nr:GTP-binding protein [Rhodothermaceae bacterium]